MTVLITGATGVVGGALLHHLLEQGSDVRAMVRRNGELPVGVEPTIGDVLDYESLLAACAGVDLVYHVAGINRMCDPHPEEMYRVNVDGTRNVIRACQATGVRRLVYTSSAATIGEPRGAIGNEDTVHRGEFLSHYERSKYLAEQVVMAEAAGLDHVIVNPSSVQGRGRASGTGKLVLDVLNGKLPFLVDSRLAIVDIDDCARGHVLAAAKGSRGRRYLLNSFSMTLREAVRLLEGVEGRKLKVRFLPRSAVVAAAPLLALPGRLAGRSPRLCSEMVRTLLHGHTFDGGRAARELGLVYTPPEVTLRRLVEWARDEGLLRSG